MISDIKAPDSSIGRQAEELARSVSNDMLFNHVMRCYWFSELFAQKHGTKVDSELMFLSSVLHDLGLTTHAPGPHRLTGVFGNRRKEVIAGFGSLEPIPSDRNPRSPAILDHTKPRNGTCHSFIGSCASTNSTSISARSGAR